MSKCRQCRSQIIDALYDELKADQKERFRAHLDDCPECARAHADMAATLGLMDQRERPEPEDVFWTGFWDRLMPHLDAEDRKEEKPRRAWFSLKPAWIMQTAAAAALIVIGVFIGKMSFQPKAQSIPMHRSAAVDASPEFVALQNRTQHYLERSKVLLLGVVNFDPETEDTEALDMPQKRLVSRSLVREAGVLKQELGEHDAQRRLVGLINDLELILMQIANMEEENDLSAVDIVKSGVDRQGVLLKINLEAMRHTESSTSEEPSNSQRNSSI